MKLLAFLACVSAFEPKLCISCKHFLTGNQYGKCKQFPYLIEPFQFDYRFASTARTFPNLCGEGTRYKQIELFPEANAA